MAIQKFTIEQFLELAKEYPVLDVRSPGEFNYAHIPGAYNVPLFTDEERKTVGTAYKQQNREAAIKIGLDYFGVKMKGMIEEVEQIISNWQLAIGNKQFTLGDKQSENKKAQPEYRDKQLPVANCLLLHCWRGGMRSAGVAWLLDLYGFKVYTLTGGYKAYRKWVLAQFEKEYQFNIIGGYTGSGKTQLLHELKKEGLNTIDLEGLACHKGSAFGALGEKEQPKQEMFENLLAQRLSDIGCLISDKGLQNQSSCTWIEDESLRIGNLQIPMPVWYTMRKSKVYFLDIPFEKRLQYISNEYGKFEKEKLVNAVIRIQKRLGGLETKNAISHLIENNYAACFCILLTYYDKWYTKGLYNRENLSFLLNKIPCKDVDTKTNLKKITACNAVTQS